MEKMTPPDDKPGAREFWIELGADLGTGMGRVRDLVHFKEIKQSTEPYSNTIHHVIEFSAYEAVCKELSAIKLSVQSFIDERDAATKELAEARAEIEYQREKKMYWYDKCCELEPKMRLKNG